MLPGSRKLRPHREGRPVWGGGPTGPEDDPTWDRPCQQESSLQDTEGEPHLLLEHSTDVRHCQDLNLFSDPYHG